MASLLYVSSIIHDKTPSQGNCEQPFPVTPASVYAFEFHLPYFALRRSTLKEFPNKANRRTGVFADEFSKNCGPGEWEYFHEAQISILLVGVDEWVWTLICLVDTYFGLEEDVEEYKNEDLDAPSGCAGEYSRPVWSPREYFLLVVSRRISQITMEWNNIVITLEQRLKFLVSISLAASIKLLLGVILD